jgi:outer membrane protein TolC
MDKNHAPVLKYISIQLSHKIIFKMHHGENMKKIINVFTGFLIICLMITTGANAGTKKTAGIQNHILTLADAIKNAMAYSPELKAAVFGEKTAEHNLGRAKAGFMPKIDFTETFSRTDAPMWAFATLLNQGRIQSKDFNPSSLNNPDGINNFNSLISVSMPVYAGGRISGSIHKADINTKIAALARERTRQAVIARTALAYTGLLLAKKNMQVILHALDSAMANLKMVKAGYNNGFSVKSDLLRAKVRIASLEQQRLDAENKIQIAKGYLNTAMGIQPETNVHVIEYFDKNSRQIKRTENNLISRAIKKRPELQILALQKQIAEEEIKIAGSANLPNINLFGTYENNTEDFGDTHNNYSIGAAMQINLFSGFASKHRIQSARYSLDRIRQLEKNMKLAVKAQVRATWLNLTSSWKRIQVAESALHQAQENLRIVKNRYKNGLLTIVSLLDAELSDQKARADHFRAVYDYESARIKLALVSGEINSDFK